MDSIDYLSKLRIVRPILVKSLIMGMFGSRAHVRHGVVLLNIRLGSMVGTLCVKLGVLPVQRVRPTLR